uniref:Uncharacterized protein n=1 Tax=Timspurckia oligopyrenoides TaxID=708627 RepID=A0A7S0ZD08_9RHOD
MEEISAENALQQNALYAFELMITPESSSLLIPKENQYQLAAVEVIKAGVVLPMFTKCASDTIDVCATVNDLSSRIEFLFHFSPELPPDSIPTAKVVGSDLVSATVLEFAFDTESSEGSFAIDFVCTEKSAGTLVRVDVSVDITSDAKRTFSIAKQCPSKELISKPHQNAALFLLSRLPNPDKGPVLYEISRESTSIPLQSSTVVDIQMKMKNSRSIHSFGPLSLTSGSSVVEARLVGVLVGGLLRRDDPERMTVLLRCHANRPDSATKVSVTLPMPPFEPLKGSWNVLCNSSSVQQSAQNDDFPLTGTIEGNRNGSHTGTDYSRIPMNERIQIGSLELTRPDVVSLGKVQPLFNVSAQTLMSSAEPRVIALKHYPTPQTISEFTLWNKIRAMPLEVSSVVVSVSHPKILSARVVIPTVFGYFYVGADGGNLNDAVRKIRLRMFCKDHGTSAVLMTLLFEDGTAVEFGFLKSCIRPQVHTRKGSTLTAGTVMRLITVLGFVFITGLLYYMLRDVLSNSRKLRDARKVPFSPFSVNKSGARPMEQHIRNA